MFALPFNDLLERAHRTHRAHHAPNAVQLSTLLSIKTGGCPEDCAYCPQAALPWSERAKNVRGAFACELDLKGLTVAVIDDVMTTGASLAELARTLKRAGAVRVENWVVARTLPPGAD